MEENGWRMEQGLEREKEFAGARKKVSDFNRDKALLISQAMTDIFDKFNANLPETFAAAALALRVCLDNEPDRFERSFYFMTLVKHLTMDHKKEVVKPVLDILRPN